MEIKEFNIPVPWGHVAVKAWGNEANTPILVTHGLSDNLASFDRLIPHLPASFYYICIDLPSHGKSSPYPPYLLISILDNIMTMKIILDYLNHKKYILMGHSWGGQTSILFTQLFPEYTLKLIVLDSFYLFPIEVRNFKDAIRSRIEDLIKLSHNIANKKQPSFTFDEAITRMIDNRFVGMTLYKEAAEPIANRALVQDENGRYKFITDPRLKSFTNLIVGSEYITKIVRKYPIKCPVLFIYTTDTEFQYFYFKKIVDEYEKNKNCIIVQVEGSHDVHNNNPEVVGPIVCKFLTSTISKL